jgi:hypothetical protein
MYEYYYTSNLFFRPDKNDLTSQPEIYQKSCPKKTLILKTTY